jgi:hypothetical protein
MSMLQRYGTLWIKNLLIATYPFFASRGTTIISSTSYYSTSEERKAALLYMYANINGMDKYFE